MYRVVDAFEPGYGPVSGFLAVFEIGLRAEVCGMLGDYEEPEEVWE